MLYICMEGCVTPDQETLKSKFSDDFVGVIRTNKMYELKSKRTQGFWIDSKDLIHSSVEVVSFMLTNHDEKDLSGKSCSIRVDEPLTSKYLLESLRETHVTFEQYPYSAITRGIDRIAGDVTKGYQQSEQMLPVGASLLALGRLVVRDGSLHLTAPKIDAPYVVTLLSRSDVLASLRRRTVIYTLLLGVCGTIGAGLLYATLRHAYKWIVRYRQEKEASAFYDSLRDRVGDNAEDSCVVCLSAPRQVVLLDCGHICLCRECSENLPEPVRCPVCRSHVDRCLPIYVS